MSPWTALLESLHSALIDEITERHPDPKPELGMPLRQSRFALPSAKVDAIILSEVSFDQSKGIALIATSTACLKTLKITNSDLWKALLKRAGSEFSRRQIQPKLGQVVEFKA